MCFDIHSIMTTLIWLVVVGAVIAVVKLLLPQVLAQFGAAGSLVLAILNVVVWAIVLIVIIIFAFELLGCLLGSPMRLR